MYHCINENSTFNPLGFLSFTPWQFRQHLKYLRNNGFKLVNLSAIWKLACEGKMANYKYAVITFDDGFLDNWLIVPQILEEFQASGTVFVNPDFTEDGFVRAAKDVPCEWGNLNYSEMKELEKKGVLDIQSHTMTHNFEFCSNKVIDFYTSQKFKNYYWLAWKLFPHEKPNWCRRIEHLKQLIPQGYPIFEYDRAITVRRFSPSDEFIDYAVRNFSASLPDYVNLLDEYNNKGQFENKQQWKQRVEYELGQSKKLLEQKLQKQVNFVCFPGGAYNDEVLQIAERAGYKAYMISSRKKTGNNYEHFKKAGKSSAIMGLNRISFTKDYPEFLDNNLVTYLNCKLKIDSYMGKRWANLFLQFLKFIRAFVGRKK